MSNIDPTSNDLWAEFESQPGYADVYYEAIMQKYGLTDEVLIRMWDRGLAVKGVDLSGMYPKLDVVEHTPAQKFFEKLLEEVEAGSMEYNERAMGFLRDAIHDPDDDHFRAQWPELF